MRCSFPLSHAVSWHASWIQVCCFSHHCQAGVNSLKCRHPIFSSLTHIRLSKRRLYCTIALADFICYRTCKYHVDTLKPWAHIKGCKLLLSLVNGFLVLDCSSSKVNHRNMLKVSHSTPQHSIQNSTSDQDFASDGACGMVSCCSSRGESN